MKKLLLSVLYIFLVSFMVISIVLVPSFESKASGGTIDDFVERCYTVTLDRGSEPDGFSYWKGLLTDGKSVGTNVAYGFLFSQEYTNKNKSNEDYVTDLYALFMGREPDEDGYNYWVSQLYEGKSREEIFAGFANSQEFYNICSGYGITAGWYVIGYDRNQVNNVNLFVERLYKTCLGRIGDQGGQKNWVERLIAKQITGVECARCFIQSNEYVNKNLPYDEYVENLYLAMMGRGSDPAGKENWVNALRNGKTKDEVFEGFANSEEFGNICKAYNIDKGVYKAKDVSPVYIYEVEIDKEMLDFVNDYRKECGLSVLDWNTDKEQVAKDRIKAIAEGGVLSHEAAGGPPAGYVGENLFKSNMGHYSSQIIFEGYKGSPGHDVNMRNASAKSCVIATCNVYRDRGGGFVTYAGQWNIQIYY